MTPKRMEMFINGGYGLTKMHWCNVWSWFGMSCIFQFEKGKKSIITFDRPPYYL